MAIKIKVETVIKDYDIKMKTFMHDEQTNITKLLSEKVIDTEEESIKKALVQLGWRPPMKMKICDRCGKDLVL